MKLPVVVWPEAEADLLTARDWYDQQRQGLGDSFAAAAEELIARIKASPELYPAASHGVRFGKLRRFPYVAYFRVLEDRIEVLAVLHGRRDPRVWQERSST